ncbi:hypothetical protein VNO78_25617 [Psophocarpus tetragonolobus]|uniref:Uncharacterized protein n=1 Tax=Psophocarpus tetragonolobus TaxID=3891 RepID=A0AAN9XFI1_PSOTE
MAALKGVVVFYGKGKKDKGPLDDETRRGLRFVENYGVWRTRGLSSVMLNLWKNLGHVTSSIYRKTRLLARLVNVAILALRALHLICVIVLLSVNINFSVVEF